MSVQKEQKNKIISEFALKEGDTGSPEVQIAVLTERILTMSAHMKSHKKDLHSQTGLIRMVNLRRRLLKYLKRKDEKRYQAVIERLGLRH